ncbi:hypothetical protein A6M21_14910 [Desulfotomaculum copahuensis]|uniref:Uncharacterized protein n=1 Tax=Desulfotomaculum copahuensis TaxID=1838280 RepID=A0A1B7LB72_9FIRM|nr:hypothetical protein A6M21_14910 [Desulfotomaculum copahuensis]
MTIELGRDMIFYIFTNGHEGIKGVRKQKRAGNRCEPAAESAPATPELQAESVTGGSKPFAAW